MKNIILNRYNYESLYLSYFSEFLTVKRFAEWLSVSEKRAARTVLKGRVLNHSRYGGIV